jgi:uncharacterized protein
MLKKLLTALAGSHLVSFAPFFADTFARGDGDSIMAELPASITAFLEGKHFAVAGVSRDGRSVANAIFRKLRDGGFDVVPVNPRATEVEGVHCYPSVAAIPHAIDGVVVATPPDAAPTVVHQCIDKGVKHVWFHRSFGRGSVSAAAMETCKAHGIAVIEGGCPLMYCEPVDGGHKCIRWMLGLFGKVPG